MARGARGNESERQNLQISSSGTPPNLSAKSEQPATRCLAERSARAASSSGPQGREVAIRAVGDDDELDAQRMNVAPTLPVFTSGGET